MHSIMQTNTLVDNTEMINEKSVMHFVADNVDHKVRTLDGFGTFHGMGIISPCTVLPSGSFGRTQRAVKKLERNLKSSEAIHYKCVPILFFEKY